MLVNWCCMCRSDAESISHLFLHCRVAHQLWTVAWVMFGMVWVQPRTVREVLLSWERGRVGRRRKKCWSWVPLCLMWLIWLERNRRTFEDVREFVIRLKGKFLAVLHFWDSGLTSPDACLFLDFLDKLAG